MLQNTIRIYNLTLLCWLLVPASILFVGWAIILGALLSFFGVSVEAKIYSLFLSAFGFSILGVLWGYFHEKKQKEKKSDDSGKGKDLELL